MIIGGEGKIFKNAPYIIYNAVAIFTAFGMLVITTIMGTPIYRDFQNNVYSFFYTLPITKKCYLWGRFLGSFIITLLIFIGILLGFIVGSVMPWVPHENITSFNFAVYLQSLFIFIVPNILFAGGIFFALSTFARSTLTIYLGGVLLFGCYMFSLPFRFGLEERYIAGLLDPFGIDAISVITRYWTVAEKNTKLLSFEGVLLYNRLIWIGVGLISLAIAFYKFKFAIPSSVSKGKKEIEDIGSQSSVSTTVGLKFNIQPSYIDSFSIQVKRFLNLTSLEFWNIVKGIAFISISLIGIINLAINLVNAGKHYDTITYPVTYMVLEIITKWGFPLYMIIIITVYSGELVWRERNLRIDQIYNALPLPNWLIFTSKLTVLILTQLLLLFIVTIAGILTQAFMGYYNFELNQYFKQIFGITFIKYAMLCVLSMFVHTLVNNKYIGHAVMIGIFAFSAFIMDNVGLRHHLFKFSSTPEYIYSDMNGYGHFTIPIIWYNIYWLSLTIILAVISNLFWVRSTEDEIKKRLALVGQRFKKPHKIFLVISGIIFISVGSFIFYNTNILNEYKTEKQIKEELAEYERHYKKYEKIPQPRITDVKVQVDIYPEKRNFFIKGTYQLKNKTQQPIDSIHIDIPIYEISINKLSFSKSYSLAKEDKKLHYYIYRLNNTLQPGDTLTMEYDLSYITKGFRDSKSNINIVYNGTFFDNSEYLPHIGYNSRGELENDNDRKKHKLPPKERMANVNDSLARMNNYVTSDADWIRYEAIISTSKDQIAITSGYLQKEWIENDRRYFHYKMDSPIWNFYPFISGRYEVKKDIWSPKVSTLKSQLSNPIEHSTTELPLKQGDVNIEVYYHKGHPYNVNSMIKSVKKSLDYYTENFGPYQHKQVRIVEFPRYREFAQSFPNTIPYSEAAGFIAWVKDDDIDYPFFITAHEVAHQWWAHQVIGGNVQGSTLMSEALAEYSALTVMEKEYGKDKMRRFLKYELDRYLWWRGSERKKEMPLYLVENQGYIHYYKGSVVMYALRDYIGEDSLNIALRRYIQDKAFQKPPYTNSLEFLSYIRAVTPDSLKYIITDMFETITLYENKATEVTYSKLMDESPLSPLNKGGTKGGTKYKVKLTVNAKKLRADSLGVESEIPINDWIDIGVFGKKTSKSKIDMGKVLYLSKHKITQPTMEFEIIVDEEPTKAGIDPYNKLIDRSLDDNTKEVKL